MAQITATTNPRVTATGNQRKTDRTQNGVLLSLLNQDDVNTGYSLYSSTDNGTTWANAGSISGQVDSTNYASMISMFVDLDDYVHAIFRRRDSGASFYARGTPNAARTSYTFGTPPAVNGTTITDSGDVVAHREGSGWVAHIAYSIRSGGGSGVVWAPITISSAGALTLGNGVFVHGLVSGTIDCLPSIDFRHTGDGKTVAASTPDLFFGCQSGATGSGRGLRFRKAAYSAGSWTMGTDREIDASHYVDAGTPSPRWLLCAFDGTRVLIGGAVYTGTQTDLVLHERDAADTATVTRTLVTTMANGTFATAGAYGYDKNGDVYFIARNTDGTTARLEVTRWSRSAGTLTRTTVQTITAASPNVSARRGYAGSAIDYVWQNGTQAAYPVFSNRVSLNQAPGAPTLTAPVSNARVDRASTITLSWSLNDPDANDSQSAYRVRYKLASASTWTTTALTQSTVTQHVLAAGTLAAGDYEWQAESTDAAGATSPWSASGFFTAADLPQAPTITAPANGATVPAQTTLTWSTPAQDAYEYRRVADNAGTPVPGTQYESSGTVVTTDRQRAVTFTVNNRTEHLQVRVRSQTLWSAWASVRVAVSFTPPAAPTVVVTAIAQADPNTVGATDALRITITDPTPTGSQPTVVSHDVEVSHDGQLTWHRVATNLPAGPWVFPWPITGVDYKVRVTAFGPSSTSSQTIGG